MLPADANGQVPRYQALNFADQQELGAKGRFGPLSGALTGFHTTTAEFGTDINAANGLFVFSRDYEAYGVEFEGQANYHGFALYGGLTWTDAKITGDGATNPTDIGHRPQRQAVWVYQLRPTYTSGPVAVARERGRHVELVHRRVEHGQAARLHDGRLVRRSRRSSSGCT